MEQSNNIVVPHYSYAIGARDAAVGGGWQLQLMKDGRESARATFPADEGPAETAAFFDAMEKGENWLLMKALSHALLVARVEPVAWANFAANGNVRIWFGDQEAAKRWADRNDFSDSNLIPLIRADQAQQLT